MRRLFILSLTAFFLLVACNDIKKPDDANFTKAINRYLAKHGQACVSIGQTFPIDVTESEQNSQYGIAPEMAALEQTGLAHANNTTAVVHGMPDGLQGPTPPQPVKRYDLTDEGKKYFRQTPGIFEKNGKFCYGEKVVDSIVKWTEPHSRTALSLVLGEVHRQLAPKPSPTPQWLYIPERGLYTGIAVFGSIGSGKTLGLILPAMWQLFAYCADDPTRRLSGIVLEVKGDLCRQLQRILKWCGRERDYVEVSLDGDIRYNPLNNSLDAYAQAFNIASVIVAIWGKGKEPFWRVSRT